MNVRNIIRRKQAGQGMTEYIIIVALIAVAAIAVTQLFGATIRNQVAGIAQEVSGKSGKDSIDQAATAAAAAKTTAKDNTKNTLSSYGDQATNGAQ
jgi:Flp pilus assembly pilin Flp